MLREGMHNDMCFCANEFCLICISVDQKAKISYTGLRPKNNDHLTNLNCIQMIVRVPFTF
jgi:hypothetical protein